LSSAKTILSVKTINSAGTQMKQIKWLILKPVYQFTVKMMVQNSDGNQKVKITPQSLILNKMVNTVLVD